MPTTGVGSEILANRLFIDLVGAVNAQLPEINLFDATHTIPWDANSDVFKPVEKLDIADLVNHFNALMGGFKTHLESEYEKGRITGAEYSKTYIALTQMAMQSAVQFALGKDQAFWMAAKTQADAITAQNQNEIARLEAMLRRASYALTKLKLASEDSGFGVSEIQRTDALPNQVLLTKEQVKMVHEQMEAQRAQTLDYRSDTEVRQSGSWPDGSPWLQGNLGIQKALYNQQIKSYQKDTELKASKVFTDLWMTAKTIEEGSVTLPFGTGATPSDPDFMSRVEEVLTKVKSSATST